MMEFRRTEDATGLRVGLLLEGKEVSRAFLHHFEMRVGGIAVRTGGIGGVGTLPEHRKKGYAAQVMNETFACMKEERRTLSLLFGIPDFYPKFGYAVVMAESRCGLRTSRALKAPVRVAFSQASADDLEAVRAMNEEIDASRTGTRVRPKGQWKAFRHGSRWAVKPDCRVSRGTDGGLEAYVVLDLRTDEVVCAEAGARSARGYESIVRFLAETASSVGKETFVVWCPPDDAFVVAARPYGVDVEVTRPVCGGPMGRILDQDALFDALLPLFSARLSRSKLSGKKVAFRIVTEIGATTIGWDGAAAGTETSRTAETCRLRAPTLAQLVWGYRDPLSAGAELEGEETSLVLETLFPVQSAYMRRPDVF